MAWWGWCIVGILLLGAEMFAIDAQFYLVFLGAGAIVVGLAGLIGIELPGWMQWIAFTVLSLGAMLAFRKQLYEKLRSRRHGEIHGDVNQRVLIPQTLAPGQSLRIEYRGSGWTAVNVGDKPIPAGEEVRIEAIDGLTLQVRC
jgi:membrane protein implicated in regulation of membrane protease activity